VAAGLYGLVLAATTWTPDHGPFGPYARRRAVWPRRPGLRTTAGRAAGCRVPDIWDQEGAPIEFGTRTAPFVGAEAREVVRHVLVGQGVATFFSRVHRESLNRVEHAAMIETKMAKWEVFFMPPDVGDNPEIVGAVKRFLTQVVEEHRSEEVSYLSLLPTVQVMVLANRERKTAYAIDADLLRAGLEQGARVMWHVSELVSGDMKDERQIAIGTLDHCAAVLMADETAKETTLASGQAVRNYWLGEHPPDSPDSVECQVIKAGVVYQVLTAVGKVDRLKAVGKMVSQALERAGGRPSQGHPDPSRPHTKWTR
jgi:hypothetical protein